MVSSLFISSVLALSAVVSASTPLVARSAANIVAGHHIGLGDVGVSRVLTNAVQVNGLDVHDNLNDARVLSDGDNIREHGNGGGNHGSGNHGSGDFGGIRDYDLGENDYGHNPFELSDGDIDGDIDAEFDDYIGDGGDNDGCGGDCGSGCGGGRGRRHPRIPHRVGRIGGGCR